MAAKIYLHLLFFCGILCQEIFATLSDKDTKLSSDLLIRKRRVVNHLPGGRNPIRIDTVNYIIRIKEGARVICAGAILSHYTVITAAPCVFQDESRYKIISNSAGAIEYQWHSITSKAVHSGNPPNQLFDGIALITVDPPFQYGRKTGNIQLYTGPLPVGTIVRVYGWGNMYPIRPGTEVRKRLRKIDLPIMNSAECRTIYESHFNITEKHICTDHEEQYCANDDGGAPLIFDNRLAGIHVWKGQYQHHRNPDVFINLQRPEYSQWIREHTLLL